MTVATMEYTLPATRDPYRDRQPPWSEDAETAVLSACLMDQDTILRVSEILDASDFYAERHRRLFRAIISLAEKATVVDPLTLANELQSRGELERSGGKDYISFLLDAVPTAANAAYHADIVKEKAILRQVISVSTELVHEAFSGQVNALQLLDVVESRMFQVSQQRKADGFQRIKEMLWPAMERIEAIQRGGHSGVTGVGSGFLDLDDMTSGFQPADLIIVAARPSMGKTAFVLNIAQQVAIEDKVPVAFFSLEMSKEALTTRMLTSEARVDAQRLRKGMLRDDEFPMLARAAGILSAAPIWIDDSHSVSLLEMRSKARRLKAEANIGLLIIDYLQLMTAGNGTRFENRQQEVTQISRGLKALAKELGIPVIALSQLSRAPEQRTGSNHRPQLADLRESGAIEQDADLVIFLYRQEMYDGPIDGDGNPLEGKAELIVSKQRNGPTGTVPLYFHKQYTRFGNAQRRPGA